MFQIFIIFIFSKENKTKNYIEKPEGNPTRQTQKQSKTTRARVQPPPALVGSLVLIQRRDEAAIVENELYLPTPLGW
jgi:hypothetical protein